MTGPEQGEEGNRTQLSPERRRLLLEEYEMIFSHFFHWDNLLWKKYRVFLVIESVFLVGGLEVVRTQLLGEPPMTSELAALFLFASVFNLFVSYVWFRTSRRNREYMDPRHVRILEIEEEFDDMLHAATYAYDAVSAKRSAEWEIHLSTWFLLIWFLAGTAASYAIAPFLAGVWSVVVLACGTYLEWGTWFKIPRSREYRQ